VIVKMTTRIYYIPRDSLGKYVINVIVQRVGCSIGDLRINYNSNTMKVPITCNDKDFSRIERILRSYDLIAS